MYDRQRKCVDLVRVFQEGWRFDRVTEWNHQLPPTGYVMPQNLMFCFSTYIPKPAHTVMRKHGDSPVICDFAVPKWLSMSSGCILALLRWVSSFHGSLFPHLTVSSLCSLIIFHLIVSRFWVQIQVFLFNYILIVEQWRHDCWIFTSAKLVSANLVNC